MPPLNTPDRVLHAIETRTTPTPSGCLIWTGWRTDDGYGRIRVAQQGFLAHRLAYELLVGPIPDGLVIDHLCHTKDPACPGGVACLHRSCLNPAHLELVTHEENSHRRGQRRTACRQGHPFNEANTYVGSNGRRSCRVCNAATARAAYRAKKVAS